MKRYYLGSIKKENLVAVIFNLHKNSGKECINLFKGIENIRADGGKFIILSENGQRKVIVNQDFLNLYFQKLACGAQLCYPA